MIRHAKKNDIPQLKEIWKEAFGEEGTYAEDFFSLVFTPEIAWCWEEQGKIQAMLYCLQAEWKAETEQRNRVGYFYALATRISSRGQGMMSQLLLHVKKELTEQGIHLFFLLPAEESLFSYYQRFGFLEKIPVVGWQMEERSHPELKYKQAEVREAEKLLTRDWALTNRNLFFSKSAEALWLKWSFQDPRQFFYKIIKESEIVGYVQGKIEQEKQVVCTYGIQAPQWCPVKKKPSWTEFRIAAADRLFLSTLQGLILD